MIQPHGAEGWPNLTQEVIFKTTARAVCPLSLQACSAVYNHPSQLWSSKEHPISLTTLSGTACQGLGLKPLLPP